MECCVLMPSCHANPWVSHTDPELTNSRKRKEGQNIKRTLLEVLERGNEEQTEQKGKGNNGGVGKEGSFGTFGSEYRIHPTM